MTPVQAANPADWGIVVSYVQLGLCNDEMGINIGWQLCKVSYRVQLAIFERGCMVSARQDHSGPTWLSGGCRDKALAVKPDTSSLHSHVHLHATN